MAGRPTKITPEVVGKLEAAFRIGCSDAEACFFAEISRDTLYEYQKKNPAFSGRKMELKSAPMLGARKVIAKAIKDGDLKTAKWYFEYTLKREIALRNLRSREERNDLNNS